MRPTRFQAVVIAALLAAVLLVAGLAYVWNRPLGPSGLVPFSSTADLNAFLDGRGSFSTSPGGLIATFDGRLAGLPAAEGAYSGTNVQVEGIDEMDVVKTDGRYLYLASGSSVYIVDAVPADGMRVVATVDARLAMGDPDAFDAVWVAGLFLHEGQLLVVASGYEKVEQPQDWPERPDLGLWFAGTPRTGVAGFDLTRIEAPALAFAHGVSGYPIAARLAGGHAYVIVQDWVRKVDGAYVLPLRCEGTACAALDVTSIYHDPEAKEVGAFTTILTARAGDGASEAISVVTGFTSTLYMSHEALYLTYVKWEGSEPSGDIIAWENMTIHTTIHKIRADGLALSPAARGDVPGTLLNQFALDERDGYLRAATTSGWQEPTSGVYVLDGDLRTVGALTGIAPTERIFAARFVGDTLYLVTFRQIDPLFVIDLSEPTAPRVLGELEVPGFSTYLHPYGEGRVLGIGQEDGALKVSLYNVSDPARPSEVDKHVVEGYAWSVALYDHKAVLVDPARSLLVLPVDGWSPEGDKTSGAYVFTVTPADVALRGIVEPADAWGVQRSLYIGEVLYVITPSSVTGVALADLSPLGSLTYAPIPGPIP